MRRGDNQRTRAGRERSPVMPTVLDFNGLDLGDWVRVGVGVRVRVMVRVRVRVWVRVSPNASPNPNPNQGELASAPPSAAKTPVAATPSAGYHPSASHDVRAA